jgi:hypothetical protein
MMQDGAQLVSNRDSRRIFLEKTLIDGSGPIRDALRRVQVRQSLRGERTLVTRIARRRSGQVFSPAVGAQSRRSGTGARVAVY